jgi:hypothetical protein
MAGTQKEAKFRPVDLTPAAVHQRQGPGTMQRKDSRAAAVAQATLQRKIQASTVNPSPATAQLKALMHSSPTVQRKAAGGLPSQLRAGIESLSGMDMGGVKVHYGSSKPAQLSAHAYAQGNAIHLGPGQEKHLPHEAWHVVQQKQGRVKPTMQFAKVNINDDKGLEGEADRMGARAMKIGSETPLQRKFAKPGGSNTTPAAQLMPKKSKGKKRP